MKDCDFDAPAIFFDLLLQKTVLDVFFICLTLWVVSRLLADGARPGLWAALGASLGALSLTRENALALVLVAIVWALAARTRQGKPRDLPYLRRVVPLLAGLALVLLPVVARNYAVDRGLYLTTSQFGANFYIGNNPGADGTYASLRPGRGSPEFERRDATELAERALQRTLTAAEVSAYWTDRALDFIRSEPGRWLALMGHKVALLWNASEMLDTESQESYEDVSPLLRALAPIGHFGLLVPLALIGLVAAWPDRPRLWPVFTLFAAYATSVVVFYVFARYRFPLVPFLTDPDAHGIDGPAFDVVIPSLPGYGFSERPAQVGVNYQHVAGLWHRLMRGLGYERYGAQGGDFGAGVATFMALNEPEPMIGVHLSNLEITPYTGSGARPSGQIPVVECPHDHGGARAERPGLPGRRVRRGRAAARGPQPGHRGAGGDDLAGRSRRARAGHDRGG